jgi:hypothetical protein
MLALLLIDFCCLFVLPTRTHTRTHTHKHTQVLDQFLATSISETSELTESYLVGNRLVKFLSVVLPTHIDYFTEEPRLVEFRNRSQAQLVELLQYMEELAMLIDEIEYNKYILKDLTPEEKDLVVHGITNNTSSMGTGTGGGSSSIVSGNDTTLTSMDESMEDYDKENGVSSTDILISSVQERLASSKGSASPSPASHESKSKKTSRTTRGQYHHHLPPQDVPPSRQPQQTPPPKRGLNHQRKVWPQESSSWTKEMQASSAPLSNHEPQPEDDNNDYHAHPPHQQQRTKQPQQHQQQPQPPKQLYSEDFLHDDTFDEFADFTKERSTHARIDLLLDESSSSPKVPAAAATARSRTSTTGGVGGGTSVTSSPPRTTPRSPPRTPGSLGSSSSQQEAGGAPTTSSSSPSSSKPVPKVKPPPTTRPRRSAPRGGGGSNGSYDIAPNALITSTHAAFLKQAMSVAPPLDEQQMTAPTMSSSSSSTKTTLGHSLRCKIEERWEEAAKFRRRLQAEQDERLSQFSEWTPSQGKLLMDNHHHHRHHPSSHVDEDSSYAEVSNTSSQVRILQQFKGCVRCLLE